MEHFNFLGTNGLFVMNHVIVSDHGMRRNAEVTFVHDGQMTNIKEVLDHARRLRFNRRGSPHHIAVRIVRPFWKCEHRRSLFAVEAYPHQTIFFFTCIFVSTSFTWNSTISWKLWDFDASAAAIIFPRMVRTYEVAITYTAER
ncbi:hypothetical protein D3C78_1527810 [compost metagenome]